MTSPALHTRYAHPGDLPYVLATWPRSYVGAYKGRDSFAEFRRSYMDPIMKADPAIVVLCSPESHATLHGYAVAAGKALAWVYVAKDLRGQGYAREAITAVLRGYPSEIRCHKAWPFESSRFIFERLRRAA